MEEVGWGGVGGGGVRWGVRGGGGGVRCVCVCVGAATSRRRRGDVAATSKNIFLEENIFYVRSKCLIRKTIYFSKGKTYFIYFKTLFL